MTTNMDLSQVSRELLQELLQSLCESERLLVWDETTGTLENATSVCVNGESFQLNMYSLSDEKSE